MKPDSREKAFRKAAVASVALHVVVVGAILLLLRATDERKPTEQGIDTRAASEPQVRISLDTPISIEIEPPTPSPTKPPEADPKATQVTETPKPAPTVPQAAEPKDTEPTSSFVAARTVPRPLPPELAALVRKSAQGTTNTAITDPNVKPAGGVPQAAGVPAMHGAFAAGKTVVYVLDCSGSMGAAGKFDAARAALVSTLKQQPATVRFQVIVYSGSASPILASNGTALPANEANIRAASDKLATLEARGRSNHIAAVSAAVAFRPDVIIMLTDADDLCAATLKPALAAQRAISVCVGRVTAEGVQRPQELK